MRARSSQPTWPRRSSTAVLTGPPVVPRRRIERRIRSDSPGSVGAPAGLPALAPAPILCLVTSAQGSERSPMGGESPYRAGRKPASGDRRNAVRGVAWGGMESTAGAAVGFLLTPLVISTFGIEGLGLWGAAWSVAHAAGVFDLGIGSTYARFTAKAIAREDAAELNGTIAAGLGFHLVVT